MFADDMIIYIKTKFLSIDNKILKPVSNYNNFERLMCTYKNQLHSYISTMNKWSLKLKHNTIYISIQKSEKLRVNLIKYM